MNNDFGNNNIEQIDIKNDYYFAEINDDLVEDYVNEISPSKAVEKPSEDKETKIIPRPIDEVIEIGNSVEEQNSAEEVKLFRPYVRVPKRLQDEIYDANIYSLLKEDIEWLESHPMYKAQKDGKLSEDALENLIGTLELATKDGFMISQLEAEEIFAAKYPASLKEDHALWCEVYHYWRFKRTKFGKSLLPCYYPVTSGTDTDPHKVFRPREKERYKLRRSRTSEADNMIKTEFIRNDLENVLRILYLADTREIAKQAALFMQEEMFEQALYEVIDTSNKPRESKIKKGEFKEKLKLPKMNRVLEVKDEAVTVDRFKRRKKKDSEKKEKAFTNGRSGLLSKASEYSENLSFPSFIEEFRNRNYFPLSNFDSFDMPRFVPEASTQQSSKYVCQGRVGRGGRVIFDRTPILQDEYNFFDVTEEEISQKTVTIVSKSFRVGGSLAKAKDKVSYPWVPISPDPSILQEVYNDVDDQDQILEPLIEKFLKVIDAPSSALFSGPSKLQCQFEV